MCLNMRPCTFINTLIVGVCSRDLICYLFLDYLQKNITILIGTTALLLFCVVMFLRAYNSIHSQFKVSLAK